MFSKVLDIHLAHSWKKSRKKSFSYMKFFISNFSKNQKKFVFELLIRAGVS